MEFAKMAEVAENNNILSKIGIYSDARVSTAGVVSLDDRLAEVRERWMKRRKVTKEFYDEILSKSAGKIEKQIFAHCKIKPEDITEEKVKPLIEDLRNFEIETS